MEGEGETMGKRILAVAPGLMICAVLSTGCIGGGQAGAAPNDDGRDETAGAAREDGRDIAVTARAGDAVARAGEGEAMARAGGASAKAGDTAGPATDGVERPNRASASSKHGGEKVRGDKAHGSDKARGGDKGRGGETRSGKAVLKIGGEPGTRFSGKCSVGDEEGEEISGSVPERFAYEPNGRELKCEVRNDSGGDLKVVFTAGDDRVAQQANAEGAEIAFEYSESGVSSSTTSSGSSGVVSQSSSSVSSSTTRSGE